MPRGLVNLSAGSVKIVFLRILSAFREDRMGIRIALGIVMLSLVAPAFAADAPAPGKTGVYSAAFARSAATNLKELAVRLGVKKLDDDYDPSKLECIVCVPDSYAPDKPMGLVVLLNYKGTNDPP